MIFFSSSAFVSTSTLFIFFFFFLYFLIGVNSGDLIHLFHIASEILANDMKGEVDVVVEAILFDFGDLTLFSITSLFLAIDVLSSNVVS